MWREAEGGEVMLQLLKLEWLKVKNYRAFWIFLGLYIVGLFSINWIAYQFPGKVKKNNVPLNIFPYDFPAVYQTIAWVSSWLLYFPGILMILVITNEYNYKTHRQNIIDGLTRQQFVAAKILFGLAIAVLKVKLSGAISGKLDRSHPFRSRVFNILATALYKRFVIYFLR